MVNPFKIELLTCELFFAFLFIRLVRQSVFIANWDPVRVMTDG